MNIINKPIIIILFKILMQQNLIAFKNYNSEQSLITCFIANYNNRLEKSIKFDFLEVCPAKCIKLIL